MVRIILLFFLFNIGLLAQPFNQSTQPTDLTIESKNLGTLETSATNGSDSLLIVISTGYMPLRIDSSWAANSVSATIYDSLLVYGKSLYVYFDYNLDTTGTIYDTVYVVHSGYGSPSSGVLEYFTYAVGDILVAPSSLIASGTTNGIDISWTDSNTPDTTTAISNTFDETSDDDDEWSAWSGTTKIIADEKLKLTRNSTTNNWQGVLRTITLEGSYWNEFSVDAYQGTGTSVWFVLQGYINDIAQTIEDSLNVEAFSDTSFTYALYGSEYDSVKIYLQMKSSADAQYCSFDNFQYRHDIPRYDSWQLQKLAYWGGVSAGEWNLLQESTNDDTSYLHPASQMSDTTEWAYRVRFVANGDYSSYSNIDTATFTPPDTQLVFGTYHVDATLGNDSNSGADILNAWQTIARVNTAISTSEVTSGDTIVFKGGEKFYDSQLYIDKDYASDVLFTSFTEWGGSELAEIGDSATSRQYNVYIDGAEYVKFEDLKFWSYYIISSADIQCAGIGIANYADYITIDSCEFVGGKDRFTQSRKVTGITIGGGSNNLTVTNSNFHDIPQGIEGSTSAAHVSTELIYNISYNQFTNNYCTSGYNASDADAVRFTGYGESAAQNYNGTIISHNNFTGFGENAIDLNSASFVLVEYNYIHTAATLAQSTELAVGIKFGDDYSEGNVCRYNVITDINRAGAIGTVKNQAITVARATSGDIYGNLIYNIGGIGIENPNAGNLPTGSADDTLRIYNNTIISDGSCIISYDTENPTQIANNILASDSIAIVSTDNVKIGYNIFPSNEGISMVAGSTPIPSDSYAIFLKYGRDMDDSLGANYYATSPIFVDSSNADFRLDTGSPAENTGRSIVITDYLGNDRDAEKLDYPLDTYLTNNKSVITQIDIGAFEK